MPQFRPARETDIDAITAIYEALHDEEEAGHIAVGWKRNVYPTRRTAELGIAAGDMFVAEDGAHIVAAGRINQEQVEVYAQAAWHYPAQPNEVMVLHSLVVDPGYQGKGVGSHFVAFYEQYALEHHCRFLRMDTNAINAGARRLYAKLGFQEVGLVSCTFNGLPGVNLVCLEKRLGRC